VWGGELEGGEEDTEGGAGVGGETVGGDDGAEKPSVSEGKHVIAITRGGSGS